MPFIASKAFVAAAAAISSLHAKQVQTPGTDPTNSPALGKETKPNPNSFNPQISLVSNFGATISDNDRTADKKADLRELELAFAADVDPFLRAEAYIAFAKENGEPITEVEEAFGRYSRLGKGLSLKFGKIAGAIGRIQRNHTDQLNFLEYPFMVEDILGPEGLRAGGGSLSYLFPGERFNELTFEALNPEDGPLFETSHSSKTVMLGHYRTFFDFGENASAQLGATYANGPGVGGGRSQIYGVDSVYKWNPGNNRQSLTFESEVLWAKPGAPGSKQAMGAFAAATWQFTPNWFGTLKYDYSEVPGTTDKRQGYSVGLTLRPTEFHHWRLELQHIQSNFEPSRNRLNLQFQMAIGAHPAHKY